jgi:biopolymer transport protein ExbD
MGELINIADIEQFFPEGTDREQLACLTKQINHFFKKDTTNIRLEEKKRAEYKKVIKAKNSIADFSRQCHTR